MLERVRAIIESFQDVQRRVKEFERYNEFFLIQRNPDGILTKPEDAVSPLFKGIFTTERFFGIGNKILEKKRLNPDEAKELEESVVTSLSGIYEFQRNEEGELQVKIQLERFAAFRYLSENVDVMKAFLNYADENGLYRCRQATKIYAQSEKDKPSIIFNFPQIEKDTCYAMLNIHTRPIRNENVNTRYLRLKLQLRNS